MRWLVVFLFLFGFTAAHAVDAALFNAQQKIAALRQLQAA